MEEMSLDRETAEYIVGLSDTGRRQYRYYLRLWLSWCSENMVPALHVRAFHIEVWGQWMTSTGHTVGSRKTGMVVVRGLYQRLYRDHVIGSDPTIGLRIPRVPRVSDGSLLTRDQAREFLAQAAGERDDVNALCRLLLLNGTRIGETLALDVDDVDLQSRTIRVTRKFGFEQHLAIPESTVDILRRILSRRRAGPLLRDEHHRRMSNQTADRNVSRLGRLAGATRRISPHSLRRTFATLCRDSGVPDRIIAAAAGWNDITMLDYYDGGRLSVQSNPSTDLEEYISMEYDNAEKAPTP